MLIWIFDFTSIAITLPTNNDVPFLFSNQLLPKMTMKTFTTAQHSVCIASLFNFFSANHAFQNITSMLVFVVIYLLGASNLKSKYCSISGQTSKNSKVLEPMITNTNQVSVNNSNIHQFTYLYLLLLQFI